MTGCDPNVLWRPEENKFFNAATAAAFKERRGITLFHGVDEWRVPEQPSWDENPFNNNTWLVFYHGLGWLYGLFYQHEVEGDAAALDEIKQLIFSWLDHFQEPTLSIYPWRDHPTALRLSVLSHLYVKRLHAHLTDAEQSVLLDRVAQHAEFLIELFDHWALQGNNHGFMDAMAVLTAGLAFPHPQARRWRELAVARLDVLRLQMVTPGEGVIVERSFGYHWFGVRLFGEAAEFLDAIGEPLAQSYRDDLAALLEFAGVMEDEHGRIPAIGDTRWRQLGNVRGNKYFKPETTTPRLAYLLSAGTEGEAPPRLQLYEKAGFALFRPNLPVAGQKPANDLRLTYAFWPKTAQDHHGHADTLSFVLYAHGRELVVDSGGPYKYGDPMHRGYLTTARAHNLVLVDGKDHPGGSEYVRSGVGDSHMFTTARHSNVEGVVHERTLVLIEDQYVLVHDRIRSEAEHDYSVLLHFAPDAEVVDENAEVVTHPDRTWLGVVSKTSAEQVERELIKGREGPNAQGWVTPDVLSLLPAPVLQQSVRGADVWFTTLLVPGRDAVRAVSLDVTGDQAEQTVRLKDGKTALEVVFSDGEPHVRMLAKAKARKPAAPPQEKDAHYGLPIYRFDSIDDLVISDEHAIYHIETGHTHGDWPVTVPLLIRPRRTPEMVVGFHGSVGRSTIKGSTRWPLFERVTISEQWPWTTVLVGDPTIQLVPDLNLGWYLGNAAFDLEPILNEIVRKLAALLGGSRLVFHGGSGGGFAALKHSTAFANSLAFVFNPQTDATLYEAGETFHSLANLFPVTSVDAFRAHKRKLSLKSYYQHPLQNYVYYIQNAGDWHKEIHADPLISFIRTQSPANWDGRLVYTLEYNQKDHAPPEPAILDAHLAFAMKRFFGS